MRSQTWKMTRIAMLSAVGCVLYFFEIPVVAFYRLDFSAFPALLAGFSMGPIAGLLVVAFLPAAVVGLALNKHIKANLYSPMPVAYALAVGGVLMIAVERWYRRTPGRKRIGIEDMTVRHALLIGVAQTLAMWPGTSRSMMTIVVGLLLGLNILAAAEFSFLLSLPTILAATLYEGYKNFHALQEAAGPLALLVGVVVSAVVAVAAIKGFIGWLTKHGLTPFGVYRLLLAGALIWYFSRM